MHSTSQKSNNAAIPTESFFIANERVMALIMGGQLTTDHLFGIADFFAPSKDSPTLVQGTRVRFVVDGAIVEPKDDAHDSVVTSREYDRDAQAVRIAWTAGGIQVNELFFVPPGADAVVQRLRVRNVTGRPVPVRLFAILYPQLGSSVENKKGVCKQARYDAGQGCLIIKDQKGNALVYGASETPSSWQVGEVCGRTDVYYDLEDGELSNNTSVAGVTPNGALGLDWGTLQPNEEREVDLYLGYARSELEGLELFQQLGAQRAALWEATRAWWFDTLQRSKLASAPTPAPISPQLAEVERRSLMVLKSGLMASGLPLGGATFYRDSTQTRNSSYILLALDMLGFHEEARRGYEHYLSFKVGDHRFASADENDQLGTILHVFRQHADLTSDWKWIDQHKTSLFQFADKLIGLIDPRNGLVYSERAIHEFVAVSRGYETYVNVMAFRGLRDAAHMAGHLGCTAEQHRFEEAAESLQQSINSQLVHPELGIFVKRIYLGKPVPLPAVSMLVPALFGAVEPNAPVVDRTLAYIREHLWDREVGGIYRYPLELQPWPETPYGGPWVTYTSWLGRVYLLRNERDKAAECLNWVLNTIPRDSNLIPEHFSVQHAGRRGFHRIYIEPSLPEMWATAEFMRLAMAFRAAQ